MRYKQSTVGFVPVGVPDKTNCPISKFCSFDLALTPIVDWNVLYNPSVTSGGPIVESLPVNPVTWSNSELAYS